MGIGSFILPMMDMQFRIMQPLQEAQPAAGIAVSALGVLLIVLGSVRDRAKKARAIAQQQQFQVPPYVPNMPLPPPQAAMWPGAQQTGNCMRCGQPLWAGDVSCRTCRLPVNFYTPQPPPQPPPQQFAYAAPPPPPVAQRCPNPNCGQPIRPGKKFCATCGTRVP
ncbi:MAG TPA: zinc ribbon domain-containing protein [Pyrinomonadaceae bacterium]